MLDVPTLLLLRASVHDRTADGTFALGLTAFMQLEPGVTVAPLWELHAYGRLQARWPDPALLAHLILCERQEPGWLALILSGRTDPEMALRSRQERQDAAQAALDEARADAAAAASRDDAEWRKRRLSLISPAAVNLSDLD